MNDQQTRSAAGSAQGLTYAPGQRSGGTIDRRTALRVGGTLGLGAALAACTGSSGAAHSSSASRTSSDSATSGSSRSSSSSTSAQPVHQPASHSGPATLAALAQRLRGPLYLPGRRGYEPGALLYNPRFAVSHPKAIARCADAADVAACVRYAADSGTPLHVRNGGHSYGGWSAGSGLVVDLRDLNSVQVAGNRRSATVGAGARLVDVYSQLAARDASIGAGSCPTVGITGLTLGGGIGVLARAYGLTCDQLRAAQVVTADGRVRTVDTNTDADLFWALRGGGGSFGAVTSLQFAVRSAPRVQRFFLQWPYAAAATVLAAWQDWAQHAPRELWSTCKLLADPGEGKHVSVSGTWTGSGSAARQLAALLAHTPAPSDRYTSTDNYLAAMLGEAGCSGQSATQCSSAALSPATRLPFVAASGIVQKSLPQAGVDAIVQAVATGMDLAGLKEGGVSFDALGGAVGDIGSTGTAFPWRSALCDVQYTATWPFARARTDPSPYQGFVHRLRSALHPWLGDAAYVNYADPALPNYARAYWGANLPRLQRAKRTYDPHDLFRFAQSVPL